MSFIQTLFRRLPVFLLVAFFAALPLCAASAKTAGLGIRAGSHDNYDRIVFDWDKMVAYDAKRNGDVLTLTFEAGLKTVPKIPSTAKLDQIGTIALLSKGADRTVFTINLAPGAQYKDIRLIRRVIIDAFGGDAAPARGAPAAPPVEAVAPHPAPQAPPVDLVAPAPRKQAQEHETPVVESAPVDKVAKAPVMPEAPVDETAEKIRSAVKEDIKTEKSEADAPQDTQPTVITIAMIEDTPLAVFERFGFLWLVLDSEVPTLTPETFGPLAGDLGRPDVYQLKGGTAYRYPMPENYHVLVNKQNLAWQVILSSKPTPEFYASYVMPQFDRDGKNARFVTAFEKAGEILALKDPAVGDVVYVVPTLSSTRRLTTGASSPDAKILPTYLGFAVVPLRPDLKIDASADSITISAEGGLLLSPPEMRITQIDPFVKPYEKDNETSDRLFNLQAWRKGGLDVFAGNRSMLLDQILEIENEEERVNALFQMALLYFANGFGHETLGLLDLVQSYDEAISKRLSFLAIRGAAKALSGRYKEAINDLGTAALQDQPEARLWRGYAAAASERWTLAEKLFPKNPVLLNGYPEKLAIPMTLYMAESALRSGDPARAARLLETLSIYEENLPGRHRAAQLYLQGEMFRQNNQPEKALEIWDQAVKYRDRLYQTKARLAKTLLEWQQKKITPAEALERLEHLRFAWRDDALETQILHSIGLLRIVNGRYYDGLVQLKNAIRHAEIRHEDTAPLTKDMLRIFKDLYVEGKASDLPPLEAISIYTEFQELMPPGEDATRAAINYSDYLVEMDLLQRAAETLEGLIEKKAVEGIKITRIGARLASIYLLDNKPNDAISILQRTGRPDLPKDLEEERQLLRARALSQLDMVSEAISALEGLDGSDARRLRADIYWRAEQWDAAAISLKNLIPPHSAESLTPEQAGYVLSAAVAFKLAGNDTAITELKRDYGALMAESALADSFAIVTRPPGRTTLTDRETMLDIAGEVDIFKSFLDSYRAQ